MQSTYVALIGFRGELIKRTEVEVKVGNLKNGKPASKDQVTGEMVKGGGCAIWPLKVV